RWLWHHLALRGDDLADARLGKTEQRVELAPREGHSFGGALHLDEPAVAGHHHVHVDLGAYVLGILEVEHRRAVYDADRDRSGGLQHRMLRERAGRDETAARVVQRDPSAADRCGPRTAVRLQHVAVDGDLHVGHQP